MDVLTQNKLSVWRLRDKLDRIVFQTTHERQYVDVLFLLTRGYYYNGWNSFLPWNLNKCLYQQWDEKKWVDVKF